ncbi:penicillin-binding protein 1B [Endozoicomonas euniceicola]|uniref:Penicillin-binding protein 1B n=1 Tax=Endozoicomonas euniceicola TaxID=1234143 RepID=A0ABY6GYH5_9GAMM|nr:penicillin-binding protein 1B [Endozoicomonas euniceicola]UYM17832.1 penicillin-binding protein 1B [Endozoicomonas euniceicola]
MVASNKDTPQKKTKRSGPKKNRSTSQRKPSDRFRRLGLLLLKLGICGFFIFMAFVVYLDAAVIPKFEGKKWAIPAKVYARPVELYEGRLLKPDELQAQLRRQGYQPVTTVRRPGTFARTGNEFIIYSRGFHFPDGTESSRYAHVRFNVNQVVSLTNRHRQPLPLLRLDPQPVGGIYPASYEDRLLIRLEQAPKHLVPALMAIEDRDFYEHWGISLSSIARALLVNVRAGGVVQGGSTLTQQLVKNFYLSNERTLIRKVQEAIMSVLLELHYSKDEILETYLNEVYLGQQGRRAIHGFGLASQFYFAQPIQELSLARTALLVGIVKGPSYYNPRRFPERAMQRRNLVLDVMANEGLVSKAEAERSKQLPLGIVSREQMRTNAFPAYLDVVKNQLRQDYAERDLTSEGLRIFTNMDPIIQRHAQSSLTRTVNAINKDKLQGAMIVTSAQTGDLLAVVGDKHPGYVGFNRAVDARRPVGSLLKPAIYLTALEQPERYTLTTPVKDLPIKVEDGRGGFWEPGNYDGKSRGDVPLYEALARSFNQATTRTGMEVGVPNVLNTIRRLGVERSLPNYPSVLLGAASLTPMDIAVMYQTFASGGFRMPLRAIDAVVDASGRPLRRYSLSVERVVDPAPMELLRRSMVSVMKEGTGRRAYWSISQDIDLAGKSGTTNDSRDSWFAGFSGNLMAVTWLGNDDNSSTGLTGSSGALKVWTDLMQRTPIRGVQPLASDRLEYVWVQPQSNLRSRQGCEGARLLPYITGSAPSMTDSCSQSVPQDGAGFFDTIKSWFN